MLKVLIADDHPLFRRGVKDLLSEAFSPVECGEAGTCYDMLMLARGRVWDIAIMDIMMPDGGGLDLVKELKVACPGIQVLVVSMHPEEQYAVRTFKAGASGYVTKASTAEELVAAVKTIQCGHKYVTASAREHLVQSVNGHHNIRPHHVLSDREYHVMCQLASGKSLKSIADEMQVSANTVSTYRRRILLKMKMKSTADVIHYAVHHSLVPCVVT